MLYKFKKFYKKYQRLFWGLSFALLFQGYWDRDYSVLQTVALPSLFTFKYIYGWEWFVISTITEISAIIIMVLTLKHKTRKIIYPLYFYFAGDIIVIVSYYQYLQNMITIGMYGLIWNDILYLIMIPAVIIMNILVY